MFKKLRRLVIHTPTTPRIPSSNIQGEIPYLEKRCLCSWVSPTLSKYLKVKVMLKAKISRERERERKNLFYLFRHIPNKSLASNTCSKHDTIGANFAQEFKDHLFILASFLWESLTLKMHSAAPCTLIQRYFSIQILNYKPRFLSLIHHVLLLVSWTFCLFLRQSHYK